MVLSNKTYVSLGADGYIKFGNINNFFIDRNKENFIYFMIDSARIMKKYIVEASVLFGYGKEMADSTIKSILYDAYVGKKDGKITLFNNFKLQTVNAFDSINSRFLFKFKGRDVHLRILENNNNKDGHKPISLLKNAYLYPMYTAYLKSMIKFKTY